MKQEKLLMREMSKREYVEIQCLKSLIDPKKDYSLGTALNRLLNEAEMIAEEYLVRKDLEKEKQTELDL